MKKNLSSMDYIPKVLYLIFSYKISKKYSTIIYFFILWKPKPSFLLLMYYFLQYFTKHTHIICSSNVNTSRIWWYIHTYHSVVKLVCIQVVLYWSFHRVRIYRVFYLILHMNTRIIISISIADKKDDNIHKNNNQYSDIQN